MVKRKKTLSVLSIFLVFVLTLTSCTTTSVTDHTKSRIGIISAMSSEMQLLVDTATIDYTDTIGGNDYHVGKLGNKDVVLVKGGVGKILASAGAATLINEYNVESIIFTGIAGGVADETEVLDVVISTDLVVHDYGTITDEGFVWRENRGTVNGRIPADSSLIEAAYNSAVSVVGSENTFKGNIATGDQFVSSQWYVEELRTKFDSYATEMEGAAVALIAFRYEVPFVVIRCMSDKADGIARESMDDFGQKAADNSAAIVINLLEQL